MKDAGLCCVCKCDIWVPDSLHDAACRSSKITFYCSYGHQQHFVQGETEEQKLRRERDRLVQRLAEKDDEVKAAERQVAAAHGQITKIRNRVGRGVCPCCNRQFENLHRHMETKHPTFHQASELN